MTVFIDTSAWYAAVDDGDRHHTRAVSVLAGFPAVVTSDHVAVETWLLLNRRFGPEVADAFWSNLRLTGIALEIVAAADLEAAWRVRHAFPDQSFSVVDYTSFAVMERVGVYRVGHLRRRLRRLPVRAGAAPGVRGAAVTPR